MSNKLTIDTLISYINEKYKKKEEDNPYFYKHLPIQSEYDDDFAIVESDKEEATKEETNKEEKKPNKVSMTMKLGELQSIAEQFNISITDKTGEKTKNKTKKQLYDEIKRKIK